MIDLHSHLLAGIDDGSPNWDTSLLMAKDAVADGVDVALMTPHHQNGKYINEKDKVIALTNEFQKMLEKYNIPLKVYASQEVRINSDLLSDLESSQILGTDEDCSYFLLEFPSNSVPSFTKDVIFRILQLGITPIIVHPERNTALMKKPDLLYDFVNQGAVTQITASSLVGTFGNAVQAFSRDIIKSGLAHMLASDAHYLPGRKYEMTAAFKELERITDARHVFIFQQNAKAVINGDDLITSEITHIKKRKLFTKY